MTVSFASVMAGKSASADGDRFTEVSRFRPNDHFEKILVSGQYFTNVAISLSRINPGFRDHAITLHTKTARRIQRSILVISLRYDDNLFYER